MSDSTFIVTEKFPQSGLSSEKRVWKSLTQAFAHDVCLAYWRYPLFSNVGERRKEPDILMLHQRLGIIIIEVKGLTIDQIHSIDGHQWNYNHFYEDCGSPYEQAENHLYNFLSMADRRPEIRRRVTGRALIALPNISKRQWEDKGFDQHPCCPPIIFKDDIDQGLAAIISETTPVQPGQVLDDGKWQRLCCVAGNNSVIKPVASSTTTLATTKAECLLKAQQIIAQFDSEQEAAAKQIPEGPQRIRGIAGSGKTVLLCQKAALMHLKHPDWDIALVFFTRSLYGTIIDLVDRYIRQFTNSEQSYNPKTSRLKVFHAWGAKDQPGLYGEVCHTVGCRKKTPRDFHNQYTPTTMLGLAINDMRRWLERTNSEISPLYDAILIDEGQDLVLDPEYKEHGVQPFYWMAYNFCKPIIKIETYSLFEPEEKFLDTKQDLRRLIWAYDEAQCLYSLAIPTAKEIFGESFSSLLQGQYEGGIKRSTVMHRCYRTPSPILTAAHAIGMGLLREEGMISGVTTKRDWEYLGYEVEGRFTSNSNILLSRPSTNSPNPIPAISSHPTIELKLYNDRRQEALSIAKKILDDINTQKLTPSKQIMVVVFSKEAEQLMASNLNELGINYYIPSEMAENTRNTPGPNKKPNQFWHDGAVTISGIHRAKGNEAEMVYVMGLDDIAKNEASLTHRNQLFVAMTRAKGWVHLSGLNDKYSFYEELEQVLASEGTYTFQYKKKPQRDLADTDLSPANE